MIGLGTLVNTGAIIIGGLLGSFVVPRVPDRVRDSIMQALGLGVILIGLKMVWSADDGLILLMLVSLAVGTAVGEIGDLDGRLHRVALHLERRLGSSGGEFARTLVRVTLLFCVGAMAITGALQDGLAGDPRILYAKAVLDGVAALIFASVSGPGIILTAFPVLIYQGLITLGAGFLSAVLSPAVITAVGATGGLMVLGIGINMTGAVEIRIANLLPALVIVALLAALNPLTYLGM